MGTWRGLTGRLGGRRIECRYDGVDQWNSTLGIPVKLGDMLF